MQSFTMFLEGKIMPIANRIAGQKYIRALRDGLAVTMPLVIIGSIFMLLANLPIPGYTDFLNRIFGEGFSDKLAYPVRATFDILSIVAVASISYQIAKEEEVDGFTSAILSMSAFILLVPVATLNNIILSDGTEASMGRVLPMTNLSAGGLIVGIIIAIITAEIFTFVVKKNWVIKMPDSVPPAVSKSFTAITPGLIILTLVWLIRVGFELTPYGTVFNFITKFVATPLSKVGLSFWGMLITVGMIHIFWSIGIHGSRVVFGVMDSILLPAMDANRNAFENGQALPNIVTKQFYDNFTNMGGLACMGLVICMLFFGRSKQIKSLSRLSVGPIIFNIAEPILFGLPIVMNPIMIIPFILAPMVIGTITYFAMFLGLVSAPVGAAVPWTVPIFFSGFLATGGDWGAVILQLINLLVSIVIYFPFLKMWDKTLLKEEMKADNTEFDN